MSEAHFTAIHDQENLLQIVGLPFDPIPGNQFAPVLRYNSRVGQQSTQASGRTGQDCRARNLLRDPAQGDQAALVNSGDQPDKVANVRDPMFYLTLFSGAKQMVALDEATGEGAPAGITKSLEEATKSFQSRNLSIINIDIMKNNFEDNDSDVIIAKNVLHHVVDSGMISHNNRIKFE